MWKELLSTSGSSNMFKLLWATFYSLVLHSLAGRQKRHEVNLPRWLFMSTCMIMYAHVIRLRCTALHIITALRVLFFLIFLLETSTVNKETPFQSFHSLVEFSTNRSRHPWPLGQTRPLLTRCSQVHKLWTTPGRRGAAESEIHTATWRPGDLACEEEGCTIWGWTWINWINYRETAKGVFSSCFRNLLFEHVWNRYVNNISWLFNTFHIPIDLV